MITQSLSLKLLQTLIQAVSMIGLDLYCKATFGSYDFWKLRNVRSYRGFTIFKTVLKLWKANGFW